MNTQKSIRCKRYPGMYEDFESVGVEQLGNALLENERRRQGCLPRRQQCDRVTNSFLKTVKLATSSTTGTRITGWIRATGIVCYTYADNSFATAQYTKISSVQTLFDILEEQMSSKSTLREASLGNNCASTRLFMRQVDAFIRHVLGFDPRSKTVWFGADCWAVSSPILHG
ncbi:hypothetical protein GQ600_3272 [Phytophthora cactorum]|nr:hypothetical protein GQ600_3272 [Phytophthora cactorum]